MPAASVSLHSTRRRTLTWASEATAQANSLVFGATAPYPPAVPPPSSLALFAVTALVLLVVPGLSVVYIVTRTIDEGRRASWRRCSPGRLRRRRAGGLRVPNSPCLNPPIGPTLGGWGRPRRTR